MIPFVYFKTERMITDSDGNEVPEENRLYPPFVVGVIIWLLFALLPARLMIHHTKSLLLR
jgi:hypothetical protein